MLAMPFFREYMKDPMHSVQKISKWFGSIQLQVVADISKIPLEIKRKRKTEGKRKKKQKSLLKSHNSSQIAPIDKMQLSLYQGVKIRVYSEKLRTFSFTCLSLFFCLSRLFFPSSCDWGKTGSWYAAYTRTKFEWSTCIYLHSALMKEIP